MRKTTLYGITSAALVLGWIISPSTAAIASPKSPRPAGPLGTSSEMRVVQQSGLATVSVPSIIPDNKQQWLSMHTQKPPSSIPDAGAKRLAQGGWTVGTDIYSEGSAKGPKDQEIHSFGYTFAQGDCGIFVCTATFTGTHASFTWLGDSPFMADQISGSTKWWIDGLAVNVTVSWPPGIGFTKSDASVTWHPDPIKGEFQETLNYNGAIVMNAANGWNTHFSAQADFQIGGGWYHVGDTD